MNIKTLERERVRKHKTMNYNHGYSHAPQGPEAYQSYPPQQNNNYPQQYGVGAGPPPQQYDYQHQQYAPQGPAPYYPEEGQGQGQQQWPPQPERILRNPHPGVRGQEQGHGHGQGQSQGPQEPYDPSRPTYNATPIYSPHPVAQSKPSIVAPSISDIFEIAAERVQQQRQHPEPSYQSLSINPPAPKPLPVPSPVPMSSSSSSFPPPSASATLEIITGLVTQMQDMFGMVSGEIFFQTSTVVGQLPSVGDKVVVEAERVAGMPFKFNAKRVQCLSKDLLSSADQNSALAPTPAPRERSPPPSQPLKSILKRNPPPPPIISKRKRSPPALAPSSSFVNPSNFPPSVGITHNSNGSFSLDLRSDFPALKGPNPALGQLYPELLYVKEDKKVTRSRSRSRTPKKSSSRRSKRSRSRSRSRERSSRRRERRRSRSNSRSRKFDKVRRRRSDDSDEVQVLTPTPSSDPSPKGEEGPNPFGEDCEIKAVVVSSTLFPRVKPRRKNFDGDNNNAFKPAIATATAPEFSNPLAPGGSKPQRPLAPIKINIGGGPLAAQNSNSKPNSENYLPNPNYGKGESSASNAKASTIVAQVEKSLKKSSKKRAEPSPLNPSSNIRDRLETVEEQQLRCLASRAQDLSAQKLLKIQEQERLLLDQRRALELTRADRSDNNTAALQAAVDEKLKSLRATWDRVMGQERPKSAEEIEEMCAEIQQARFQDEERRLKAAGDSSGLAALYKEWGRARRKAEEERLQRLHAEELALKKAKDWSGLKKLREEHGSNSEREEELNKLRGIRKKEEAEESKKFEALKEKALQEEALLAMQEENRRREVERPQRGCEGLVSREPQPRRRSRSASRSPRHSKSSRHRSRSRDRTSSRRSRRSRSRSRSRHSDERGEALRRAAEEEAIRRAQQEQLMAAQLDAVRRHEEALAARERELEQRMALMGHVADQERERELMARDRERESMMREALAREREEIARYEQQQQQQQQRVIRPFDFERDRDHDHGQQVRLCGAGSPALCL